MSKQENYEDLKGNELTYRKVGDYFIPDLELTEENRPIGKYGHMHREYLKEHCSIRYNDLVLSGQLWTYLADLNEQAQKSGFNYPADEGSGRRYRRIESG